MFVDDRGGSPRLACESLPGLSAARQVRRQDFDRHRPVELPIKGFEDNAHPASPDQPFDVVPPQTPEHFGMGRR